MNYVEHSTKRFGKCLEVDVEGLSPRLMCVIALQAEHLGINVACS
jgi:hypothetical protein